jgi:hypothetical protein
MFTYRLYTEDKNRTRIRQLVSTSFSSYTVYTGIGVWKDNAELSLVIEIISTELSTLSLLKHIANIIKEENQQQAVLVTRTPVEDFLF